MNAPTPEPGLLEQLYALANRARTLAARPDLKTGQVRIFNGMVRAQLKKLFGASSEVVKAWPGPDDLVQEGRQKEIFCLQIGTLESLIAGVSSSAQRALVPNSGNRVFIGHGRSPVWRELKDFLQDRLRLPWEEFNRESTAGVATTTRLEEMLAAATFALLIMTAEDEHADARLHARENVIHEVGLFQGKLGTRRAIILREEGCQVFSNIHGLTYIGFPKGMIGAAFEEIRLVLERERVLAR